VAPIEKPTRTTLGVSATHSGNARFVAATARAIRAFVSAGDDQASVASLAPGPRGQTRKG
jgi:hypothetical protein